MKPSPPPPAGRNPDPPSASFDDVRPEIVPQLPVNTGDDSTQKNVDAGDNTAGNGQVEHINVENMDLLSYSPSSTSSHDVDALNQETLDSGTSNLDDISKDLVEDQASDKHDHGVDEQDEMLTEDVEDSVTEILSGELDDIDLSGTSGAGQVGLTISTEAGEFTDTTDDAEGRPTETLFDELDDIDPTGTADRVVKPSGLAVSGCTKNDEIIETGIMIEENVLPVNSDKTATIHHEPVETILNISNGNDTLVENNPVSTSVDSSCLAPAATTKNKPSVRKSTRRRGTRLHPKTKINTIVDLEDFVDSWFGIASEYISEPENYYSCHATHFPDGSVSLSMKKA